MSVEVVDDLFQGVAEGAHADHYAVGVGGAVVVEEVIAGAQLLVDLVHVALDDLGQRVVRAVARLAMLEEDVAVLVGAAGGGVLGVERMVAEGLDGVHVDHVLEVLEIPGGHLLDLVRGAEAIEEVEEGHAALDGGQVGHRSQVHDLLDVALSQHGIAGLAASHDVGVVAKDVEGLGGHGTGAHMQHVGQALAGHLVHVGDHQQQTLGGRVAGGEGASAQRAVNSAGGAGLRLHLLDFHRGAKDVLETLSSPLIHMISHGAGWRDGINARHLGEGIRDPGCGLVAIH